MGPKKVTYSLFLIALIVFKVISAAIHIQLHHDNTHHCEHNHHIGNNHNQDHNGSGDSDKECKLCENALFILNAEFSVTTTFHFVNENVTTEFELPKNDYESRLLKASYYSAHSVRPPPYQV